MNIIIEFNVTINAKYFYIIRSELLNSLSEITFSTVIFSVNVIYDTIKSKRKIIILLSYFFIKLIYIRLHNIFSFTSTISQM